MVALADIHSPDWPGHAISDADSLGIPGERRCHRCHHQHAGLSPLLLTRRDGHLQYRGNACQPPEDEHRLHWHLRLHTDCLRHWLRTERELPYRQLGLRDDCHVRHKPGLLHLHDHGGNQKTQENAGDDGGQRHSALRAVCPGQRHYPFAIGFCHPFCCSLH